MTEQEYRASLKRHHICRNCKQTDAYTLAGRTYCAECAEKDAEKKRKLRENEEYRQKAIQTTREWRNKNAAENRCARCGKPMPTGWKNKCCAAAAFNVLGAMLMENTMPDMNDLPLRKGKKTFNYFE